MRQRKKSTLINIGLIAFLLLFSLSWAGSVGVEKTILLVGADETKRSTHGQWLKLIYTEVFRRLGYKLKYEGYPATRASIKSAFGEVEGEISRVSEYGSKHPNLIRVDESHFTINFSAYAIDPKIKLDGWKSLGETNYPIGYRRGVMLCELKLPEFVSSQKLMQASSVEQGLNQIVGGRVGVFVGVQRVIEDTIRDNRQFDHTALRRVGIIDTVSVHAYIHKNYQFLVPKISGVLKQMKAEGLIKKYRKMIE
jgi:polar amino acid transport system substrate-binding protein